MPRTLLVALLACVACATPPDEPPMLVAVGFEDGALIVVNQDARRWTDCTATVQPGGYGARIPEIAPGERARVVQANLADPQGVRFNPYRQKPIDFELACTVNGTPQTLRTPFSYGPK